MDCSLILLPTYNEIASIHGVIPRLAALPDAVDILVIDDASPDGTGEAAEALRERYPRLSVLHRRRKEGLGRAYVHGFTEALARGYSRIVTMDADLSHSPEDVPRLLDALDEADVALGSRQVAGGGVEDWPLPRRALSRAGSLYARTLLGIPARDVTTGFRAYRAEALRALDLESLTARGFVFQIEILRRLLDQGELSIAEVPIVFRNRRAGTSKLSWGIIGEAAFEVARLRLGFRPSSAPPKGGRARRSETISVIVPVRDASHPPAAARSELMDDPRVSEIITVDGRSPSAQPNAAARAATGDVVLLLDEDSELIPGLRTAYLGAFNEIPYYMLGRAFSTEGTASERHSPLVTMSQGARREAEANCVVGIVARSAQRESLESATSARRITDSERRTCALTRRHGPEGASHVGGAASNRLSYDRPTVAGRGGDSLPRLVSGLASRQCERTYGDKTSMKAMWRSIVAVVVSTSLFLTSCTVTQTVTGGTWWDIRLHPEDVPNVNSAEDFINLTGLTGVSPANMSFLKRADGTIRVCISSTTTITIDPLKFLEVILRSKPNPSNPQEEIELPNPNVSVPSASTLRVENNATTASMYVSSIYIDGVAVTTTGTTIAAGATQDYTIPSSVAQSGTHEYTLELTYGPNSADTATMELTVSMTVSPLYVSGDVNGDGNINVSDPTYLQNYFFLGGPPPQCDEAADANEDDSVNQSDSIYLLNYLFGAGPAPLPGPLATCFRELDPGLTCYNNGSCPSS